MQAFSNFLENLGKLWGNFGETFLIFRKCLGTFWETLLTISEEKVFRGENPPPPGGAPPEPPGGVPGPNTIPPPGILNIHPPGAKVRLPRQRLVWGPL